MLISTMALYRVKVLVLLQSVVSFQVATSQSCDLNELDRHGRDLLYLGAPLGTLQSYEEVDALCLVAENGAKGVLAFAHQCLKREVELGLDIFIKGVGKVRAAFCQDGGNFYEVYFQHQTCTGEVTKQRDSCMPSFVASLEAASTASIEHAMSLACCFYYEFLECMKSEVVLSSCENSMKEIKTLSEQMGSQLLSDGCVETSSECAQLPVIDRSQPPNYMSPVPPLVNILKKVYKE